MTGLVNSVVHATRLPDAGPLVQTALFPDDPKRTIAELERRLIESEAAYLALCDHIDTLETDRRHLQQEITCWRRRCELAEAVWMRLAYGGRR